ncbi:GUN4 domain-containing protein [Crocosphaera sp. UHCC 0190]|nr:GUN4 domain-containing protein [Crocosphaera sp. UHCC 0190]
MKMTAPFPKLLLAFVFSCLSLSAISAQEMPKNDQSLISPETGVDFSPLRNRLEKQEWLKANEITNTLILQSIKRDEQGWMSRDDIATMPCWDLKTIDQLWKEYSQGRFGFSVQFSIFVETGNKPGRLLASDAYDDFGTRIGWRKDGQWVAFKQNLDYSLDAPLGHLPNPRSEYQITGGRLNYTALTQRMVECRLVNYSDPRKPFNYQP